MIAAMNAETRQALNAINRRFYRDFAASFDATRAEPWSGWRRVDGHLEGGTAPVRLLDLGCGNGRLGAYLAPRLGERLVYTGVDASAELLAAAGRRLAGLRAPRLLRFDFVEEPLAEVLGAERFEAAACFGLLHHLPGRAARRELLGDLAAHLVPEGLLAAGIWRFGADERFRKRLRLWDTYNAQAPGLGLPKIDPAHLEPGDHLLGWGREDSAFRYCHSVDDEEEAEMVTALERDASLSLVERFDADGRSGKLNRYLILRRGSLE